MTETMANARRWSSPASRCRASINSPCQPGNRRVTLFIHRTAGTGAIPDRRRPGSRGRSCRPWMPSPDRLWAWVGVGRERAGGARKKAARRGVRAGARSLLVGVLVYRTDRRGLDRVLFADRAVRLSPDRARKERPPVAGLRPLSLSRGALNASVGEGWISLLS